MQKFVWEETFPAQFRTGVSRQSCLHSNICKEEDQLIAYRTNRKAFMSSVLAELIQQTQDKAKKFRKSVLKKYVMKKICDKRYRCKTILKPNAKGT